ncbi:helix-turn-helix domain-containing protein [Arundinibacter roseus]|uniref:AraC family transcriptional regulator n=1 Tax=Arundinibacter roseus TaxID=2070510 RepID=A0A4R4KHB2_9BACT|nr:AraC family transcriptional regulator [Arundinibacter roseus]TDB67474.1 AraC family transcriptional regulator [Arundinibacter roseus]
MDVKIYVPHLALQEYVLTISTVHVKLPENHCEVVTPYPPTPFQSLIFYCNDPVAMGRDLQTKFDKQPSIVLIGPQYSRVNIRVSNQLRAIRVDFLPGGMYRMLGIPMIDLLDAGLDAQDVFGSEMRIIHEQLCNLSELEEGKNIVEKFLLKQATALKTRLPFDAAMRILLSTDGRLSMEKTASLSCLSLRQFERTCKERIGMNPKMYARILRFSRAYRLREAFPHMSWIKIAYEAGYYDQMHMIRDFKVFAGVNPSIIEQQLLLTPLRMQKDLRW